MVDETTSCTPAGGRPAPRPRAGWRRWGAAGALLLGCAACGGDRATAPEPPPTEPIAADRRPATLRFVAGANQVDTIDALAPEPLVLEVRDALDRPAPNVQVLVGSFLMLGDGYDQQQGIQLLPAVGTSGGGSVLGVRTDAEGRAAVRFRFARRAAPTLVLAQVAENRTVEGFTVVGTRTGQPARLALSPADTALYAGATFTPAGRSFDRSGTELPDAVTVHAVVGPLEHRDDGRITALALGRGSITMRAGSAIDSIRVGVPPEGVIAALQVPTCSSMTSLCRQTVVLNLDGSGLRTVAPLRSSYLAPPAWSPDGQTLVAAEYDGTMEQLVAVHLASGERRPLVAPAPARQHGGFWGRLSRDGAWLYYSSAAGWPAFPKQWRQPMAGGEPERLGSSDPAETNWRGDPSPDGRRLALVSARDGQPLRLVLLDLESGASQVLDVAGQSPRWSPDGTRLAYILSTDQSLWVMDGDGANHRQLSRPGAVYGEGADWSSDGRWLIARGGQWLELLPTAGGEPIPLPYSATLVSPSFRP